MVTSGPWIPLRASRLGSCRDTEAFRGPILQSEHVQSCLPGCVKRLPEQGRPDGSYVKPDLASRRSIHIRPDHHIKSVNEMYIWLDITADIFSQVNNNQTHKSSCVDGAFRRRSACSSVENPNRPPIYFWNRAWYLSASNRTPLSQLSGANRARSPAGFPKKEWRQSWKASYGSDSDKYSVN